MKLHILLQAPGVTCETTLITDKISLIQERINTQLEDLKRTRAKISSLTINITNED